MEYTPPGRHRDVASFRAHLRALDPAFDVDPVVLGRAGPLGQPLEVAGVRVGNRFAIHPMEGWDGTRSGLPGELTLRRWTHFGRSGAKLIWGGEAFAVSADGRANPNQLFLNEREEVEAALVGLRGAILAGHRERGEGTDDLLIGLQLTHSGRFARPDGPPAPRLAYRHPVLDTRFRVAPDLPLLTDGELEAIGERFVAAARLAARAGFQFVDVKCCHGYLLHELLSARLRPGPYGGGFEGRTRLFRRIVAGVRASCPGLALGVRVSLADTFPFAADPATRVGAPLGWEHHLPWRCGFGVDERDPRQLDLTEPFRFLELLRELGIRLVNVSLGSPYYSPHWLRPASYPPSDGYLPPEDPLAGVLRHLQVVRAAKQRCPDLVLVGSGYTYLQEWLAHVAQHEVRQGHVNFVGLGRMVLAHPGFVADVLDGRAHERRRICRTFSDCTTAPRHGLVSGCFPLDPDYKALPQWEELQRVKERMKEERQRAGSRPPREPA